jgi:hypothetical protein
LLDIQIPDRLGVRLDEPLPWVHRVLSTPVPPATPLKGCAASRKLRDNVEGVVFADPAEKSTHDEIVKMVEEMLDLQKQRQQAEAAKEDVRFALQKRIQALETEIDAQVYRLYGLTEEEVKIVEGG